MRAQILLRNGPFDMHLISYATHNTEFPLELRVATQGDDEAAVYRRVEVEDAPVSLMKFGAYEFSGMRKSAEALIDVWIDRKEDHD